MAKTALVALDLSIGPKILEALDRASLSISVAMWAYLAEYDDWRFVLASRHLDAAEPAAAYGLVHKALKAAKIPLELTPTLSIFRMSDPFVRELRQTFAKAKDVEGMRLGGQLIGDRFLEDAIVYRIR
jgi:hypothetical protein